MPQSHNLELDKFLNLLFSWDPAGSKFYKAVAWTFIKNDDLGKPQTHLANYVADSYDSLVRLIESRSNKPYSNVYICLGMQRVANTDKVVNGFYKAVRKHNNIAAYKSIWLDLDVKPGAFATTNDALYALAQFIQ